MTSERDSEDSIRRRHGRNLQLGHRHSAGRPEEQVPDGSRGQVLRHQGRVQAADEGGRAQGSLPRMAACHDEGIPGQRLLFPGLRGGHETTTPLFSVKTKKKRKFIKSTYIVNAYRVVNRKQKKRDNFCSETGKP